MLRSIGKQSGVSVESVMKKKKATVGRICRKGNVLSLEWKSEEVIDNESGESIWKDYWTKYKLLKRSKVFLKIFFGTFVNWTLNTAYWRRRSGAEEILWNILQ